MILAISGSSWLKSLGQLMSVLLIFLIVLFLTWLTTRWIAGYQLKQVYNQNLRIVETLKLTMNSYIQIIEAGDVYLVIAVSKDHIEKIAELTKDQLKTAPSDMAGQKTDMEKSFHDVFDKVRQHFPKK